MSGTDIPRPSRRRVWITIAVTAAVLAAVGTTAAFVVPALARPAASEERPAPKAAATATVDRGDLTERIKASGSLAFGAAHDVGTTLVGTITWVPETGAVIGRGEQLLRIDDRPVVLLFGDLPVWRSFEEGMADGRDVLQLEQNLRELGFFADEPDETFTWRTVQAIRVWQQAVGLKRTGSLELGRIVFQPAEIRVGAVQGPVGSPADPSALSATGTTKLIGIDLDVKLVATTAVGARVEITLPGGAMTTATVVSIGTPVEKESTTGGTDVKVPLVLIPDDPGAVAAFDEAKVSAAFTRTLATAVLRVPVTALLAGRGGTIEIEVMTGTATRTVEVATGVFGDGLVEITGGDLSEGDVVVVAE